MATGGQGKGEPLGMKTLCSLVLWGQLRKGGPKEVWRMDVGAVGGTKGPVSALKGKWTLGRGGPL